MNIRNTIIQNLIICGLSQQIVYAEESFKGVFLGIEGGYIFGNSHLDRKINKAVLPNLKNDEFHLSSHGIIGGGLLEYNHMLTDKFLLGFQVNAKWSRLNGKVDNSNIMLNQSIVSDLKMKQSYSVILKGGYHSHKMLPYMTVGLLASKWSSKTQGIPALGQGGIAKNLTGYELGAGIDYSLTKNIVIGIKFSHTWYPKFNYFNRLSSGETLHKIEVRPQTNMLSFNFKYKFNTFM